MAAIAFRECLAMSLPANPTPWIPYLLPLLLGWVYYRRIRRSFGPQPWQPRRTVLRLVVLVLVAAMLGLAATVVPRSGPALAGGAVAGLLLGWIGVRHTHAEWRAGVRTYIPNPWIGGVLTLVLLGRLAWRYLHAGGLQAAGQPSALTLGLAAALVAYGLAYSIGLLRRMATLGAHPPAA